MDESDCICRKCKKKVGYLQSGLCNECINKVSFMDYWELKTPEEAVRLFIIQDLNKEIFKRNQGMITKLKPDMINGRIEECPKSLEKLLKEDGEWEHLLKRVQQIPKEEETKKKNPRLEDLENQLEYANEKLEDTKHTIKKLEMRIDQIKTLAQCKELGNT